MNKIILLGSGGHAQSCIDVIESTNQYEVGGFVTDEDKSKSNLRYPVLGTDDDLENLRKKYKFALVTVGQIKSPSLRIKLFNRLKELNYKLPRIISPQSYISNNSHIGEGTIILHGAIINTNVKVGKNCIVNSKALIEHDSIIGDNCHISTGAIINGGVKVGDGTFIGSGSITKQSITIGDLCVVKAGIFVNNDIKSKGGIVNN